MTTGDSSYTATGTMLIRSDSELERLRLEHAGDLQDVAGNDEDNDEDNDNYNGDNVIDNGNIDNNPMYVSDAAIDFDPEADSPTASFDVEAQQRQSQRRRRADSSHFVTAENTMTEEDAEAASGIVGELALAALADALGECDDDPATTTHGTIHGSDRGTIHGPSHGTIHGPSHATSHVAIDFDDGMATTKISPMRGMDEGRHEAPAWTRSQLKDIFSPLTLEEMFQQKERTASAEIDADAAEVHCEEAVNVADVSGSGTVVSKSLK